MPLHDPRPCPALTINEPSDVLGSAGVKGAHLDEVGLDIARVREAETVSVGKQT
jgi:hypothetical protein